MHQLTELYIDLKPDYEAYAEKLFDLLTEKLATNNIQYHKLEYRLKSPESVEDKIERKPHRIESLADITDLIGFRIISCWAEDIPGIMKLIQSEFSYNANRSGIKMSPEITKQNYKYVYYGLVLAKDDLESPRFVSHDRLWFEVQIMSLLQYAGSELQRRAITKYDIVIPFAARKKLNRVSALLDIVETEMAMARTEILANEKKVSVLFKRILKEMPVETPLDMPSVMSFVIANDFIQTFDRRLNEHHYNDYKEEFLLLDAYVDEANYLGISSLKDLCYLLFENQKRLMIFNTALKQVTQKKEEFIQGAIYLGVSIGTLCSYFLAQKADLDFAKAYYSKFWKDMDEDYIESFYPQLLEAYNYTEKEMKNK